jgi:ketosteroid isomerase-like protein
MLASAFRSGVTQSSAATASFVWRPTSAIASTDGRFGCTYGVATYPPATASDSAIAGVYATCWRRDSDGQWRIVAHQHNQRVEIAGGDWPTWSLRVRPHSAVYAFVGDAGQEAQLADADFAKLAAGEWGPGPAFSRFIGDDGLLFGPPEFPSGPGGAERAFAEFPPGRVLAWGPLAGFGSGGLAVTVGHASTHSRVAGAADLSRSKYLTIWRQRADGRWEYVLDFGSGRP